MAFGRKPLIGLQTLAFVGLIAVVACQDARVFPDDGKGDAPGGSIGGNIGDDDDAKPTTRVPCTKDPSYYDVPGDECDNDGDGVVDNPPTCDATDDPDPAVAFARTLGICTDAADKGYGLVAAKLTRGFGRSQVAIAEQHGVLPKFGNVVRPREGKKLGVLSTGYAEEFNGAAGRDFSGKAWVPQVQDGSNGLPPGFPKAAEGCDQRSDTNDVVALHLELKAPKNSSGFAFDFDFFTAEWPQYVCSDFNDGFIAYLTAKSFNGGRGDNVSFDSRGNPVSVNNGFFDRCVKGIPLACETINATTSTCAAGTGELQGTGFGNVDDALFLPRCGRSVRSTLGGATGWLFSQAPVAAEEQISLDFVVWDTKDTQLDSTVLLDNFRWILGNVPTEVVTERPPDVK